MNCPYKRYTWKEKLTTDENNTTFFIFFCSRNDGKRYKIEPFPLKFKEMGISAANPAHYKSA